jgi:hypothetical protein
MASLSLHMSGFVVLGIMPHNRNVLIERDSSIDSFRRTQLNPGANPTITSYVQRQRCENLQRHG